MPVWVAALTILPTSTWRSPTMPEIGQTLRETLGYDHQFGNGFVGTLEGIYTRGLNSFFYQNINIGKPTGVDRFGRTI